MSQHHIAEQKPDLQQAVLMTSGSAQSELFEAEGGATVATQTAAPRRPSRAKVERKALKELNYDLLEETCCPTGRPKF